MAQMSLEMHFEPVSSDEEEDFGDEYEPISDDNYSVISENDSCGFDQDSIDIDQQRSPSVYSNEGATKRSRSEESFTRVDEPLSTVKSEPKRIKLDVIAILENPKKASAKTTALSEIQNRSQQPPVEAARQPAIPKLVYEVRSCLNEFGDKVDGRNFDIMSLYTWGTKAQLQNALEAHMIFAERLKADQHRRSELGQVSPISSS